MRRPSSPLILLPKRLYSRSRSLISLEEITESKVTIRAAGAKSVASGDDKPRDSLLSMITPRSSGQSLDKISDILKSNKEDFLSGERGVRPLRRLGQTHKSIEKLELMDQIDGRSKREKSNGSPITNADPEMLFNAASDFKPRLFSELGLPTWLIETLSSKNINQPTRVQQLIIEGMLETDKTKQRRSILVRGQTGTGKSLGYIIALLGHIHREKALKTLGNILTCHHLILVPNSILALQLLRWARTLLAQNCFLSQTLSTTVRVMIPESERAQLQGDVYPEDISNPKGFAHIVIGTPRMIREMAAKGQFNIASLNTIILDEADALIKSLSAYATEKERLNRAKHPVTSMCLLSEINKHFEENKQTPPRIIAASASLNSPTRLDLKKTGLLTMPSLFISDQTKAKEVPSCPPQIKHYYRMLQDADSFEELMQLVQWIFEERQGQLGALFIPTTKSKTSMQGWLESVGIPSHVLSDQSGLTQFISQDRVQQGGALLIGSDVDARGWDLPRLKYVIIVDLPETPTHYLHMAGRVGRMGAEGSVYTFIAGEKDLERLTSLFSMLKVSSSVFIPAPRTGKPDGGEYGDEISLKESQAHE